MNQLEKARVFRNGRSQAVRMPAAYRFKTDEVYIRHNAVTGELTLSEQQLQPSLDEFYAELDAAGAADFIFNRDFSPNSEREEMCPAPLCTYRMQTQSLMFLTGIPRLFAKDLKKSYRTLW